MPLSLGASSPVASSSQHKLQVTKASSQQLLEDQRVSLIVDQRGVVVSVAGASPTVLFEFDAQKDLVGRPLAAFINLFEEFRVKLQNGSFRDAAPAKAGLGPEQGNDLLAANNPWHSSSGLTAGLVTDDSVLLTVLAQAAQAGSSSSYRVGVRAMPLADEQIGRKVGQSGDGSSQAPSLTGGAAAAGFASLLATLGGKVANKLRPAVMVVDVLEQDLAGEGAAGLASAMSGVQFVVSGCWMTARMQQAHVGPKYYEQPVC